MQTAELGGIVRAFGIRHLSPAGAYYVRDLLDKEQPELVLIEGPADFDPLIDDIVSKELTPPFALMAYTKKAPVETVLYPFANYSPEYQAILWAKENNRECHFFDLESDLLLALPKRFEETYEDENIYEDLTLNSGEGDLESFWERNVEQSENAYSYMEKSELFGRLLRENSKKNSPSMARDVVRESFMKRRIVEFIKRGADPDKIFLITGAFHISAFQDLEDAMTDKEYKSLKKSETGLTLMPYSYYRLSKRTGYGAGNAAPAYYELIWQGLLEGDDFFHERKYLSLLAKNIREYGGIVSSAQVIESVRLSRELAKLRGGAVPILRDLKDAGITCMGEGNFSQMATGFASTDIGTRIGMVPQGVMQTSIQNDFLSQLKNLKLEKYKELTAKPLQLDLRENLRAKTEESAFLDLNRSFFLNRLRALGIDFAKPARNNQENATWREDWVLQWSPEVEIQIVETVLKGDTVYEATAFVLGERINEASNVSEIADIIVTAFNCGMPKVSQGAIVKIDEMANGAVSIHDAALTVSKLSAMITFGDIRKLDRKPLEPIVKRLCIRASLMLSGEAACDDMAANTLTEDIQKINEVYSVQDFLEEELWFNKLMEIAKRDDLNTKISGLSTAILLDRGRMGEEELRAEVSRRMSAGMPAELGAGWFEGLSVRNHYALIARLSLWESLSQYMDTLDEEEFRRSLVFLRRAFALYSAKEKDMIAESLGEIWGVDANTVSEVINSQVKEVDTQILEDFDFGDF